MSLTDVQTNGATARTNWPIALETEPTPPRRRPLVFAAAAILAAAGLGFGGGFLVADDASTVADLRAEQDALRTEMDDEIEALELELEASTADLTDLATEADDYATLSDELIDAWSHYLATPVGSQEETDAWFALGVLMDEVAGTTEYLQNVVDEFLPADG